MNRGKTPDRKRNNCRYAKLCGGCEYAGTAYSEQAAKKKALVDSLIGGICRVDDIIECEDPFYYRNKVHSGFKRLKNGRVLCGPYQRGSHRMIDCDECLLENRTAGAIVRDCAAIAGQLHMNIYNEVSGTGELRRVLVRVAESTGEIMVVLVIGKKYFTAKKLFVHRLTAMHPEITTVLVNVNTRRDSMILGDATRTEYGPGFITDTLLGLKFSISPSSFYQVNSAQTARLYSTTLQLAGLKGDETVLDCYSGIGTITLCTAKIAGHVIGVENNPEAVKDANKNKRINNIKNAEFICTDATDYMERCAAEGTKPDVVILDPTRLGTTPEFVAACAVASPRKVIYVSCAPDTLARDLKLFASMGFIPERAVPVDMFPWTEHVETVVLMSRQNA